MFQQHFGTHLCNQIDEFQLKCLGRLDRMVNPPKRSQRMIVFFVFYTNQLKKVLKSIYGQSFGISDCEARQVHHPHQDQVGAKGYAHGGGKEAVGFQALG